MNRYYINILVLGFLFLSFSCSNDQAKTKMDELVGTWVNPKCKTCAPLVFYVDGEQLYYRKSENITPLIFENNYFKQDIPMGSPIVITADTLRFSGSNSTYVKNQ